MMTGSIKIRFGRISFLPVPCTTTSNIEMATQCFCSKCPFMTIFLCYILFLWKSHSKSENFKLERNMYQNKPRSLIQLRSLKITPFSPLLRSSAEKTALFKLRENSGFESCCNIPFPLIQCGMFVLCKNWRYLIKSIASSRVKYLFVS